MHTSFEANNPILEMRGKNSDAVHACNCRAVMRRVLEYVTLVYASHDMHMSNSQARTCHSEHGRITGAAVS